MTSSDWRELAPSAILVLDDDAGIRAVAGRGLARDGYEVLAAADLAEAREQLAIRDVVIVLADVTLRDGESGLELLSELHHTRPEVDVLVMTARQDVSTAVGALQLGAADYLCKPFTLDVLRSAVRRTVDRQRLAERLLLAEQLEARRLTDEEHLEQFLVSLATMIDAKSRFTARHGQRVSELARLLGEAMGYDERRCDLVARGGRLHDIGKVGVPDAVLDKPGPLTRREFALIRQHPRIGDELIAPIRTLQELRPMIRWHHEDLDGSGYPDGLGAHEVPEEAWVVKVADFWEAITAPRPYREPATPEQAVRCLRQEAGVRIPREIVETFLEAIQGAPVALPLARRRAPSLLSLSGLGVGAA